MLAERKAGQRRNRRVLRGAKKHIEQRNDKGEIEQPENDIQENINNVLRYIMVIRFGKLQQPEKDLHLRGVKIEAFELISQVKQRIRVTGRCAAAGACAKAVV